MQPVAVRILHPIASPQAGELERWLADERRANADALTGRFRAAGATDVRILEGAPDRRPFGARLRELVPGEPLGGLVVLGSGAIPLARGSFVGDLVAVAASGDRRALTNSFYSADVVAIGDTSVLAGVPDLPSDNALPRWLRERTGYRVDDARGRWRLAIDIDSPLDVVLLGRAPLDARANVVRDRLTRLDGVAADPRAELVVAGRASASTLRWLERRTASRTRAILEERGLRSRGLAEGQRPPRSLLGLALDERGPGALGEILAQLGDAAVVDSRVLLAHRLGPDEDGWPRPEDRFASDLLLPDRIEDPWLRALTAAARDAGIPVLMGGHTLIGPGLRLALRWHRAGGRRA